MDKNTTQNIISRLIFLALIFIINPQGPLTFSNGLTLEKPCDRSSDLHRAILEEESFETPSTYPIKESLYSTEQISDEHDLIPNIKPGHGTVHSSPIRGKPNRGKGKTHHPQYSAEDTIEDDYTPGGIYQTKHGTIRPQNNHKTKRPKPGQGSSNYPSNSDYDDDDDDQNSSGIPSNPGTGSHKPNNPKQPGKIILEEKFSERSWDSKWVYTKFTSNDTQQKFEKFYRIRAKIRPGNKGSDYGIMTSNKGGEDYAISTTFPSINSNEGTLVIQFSLQYQTSPYCEYIFLRLFDCRFKPEEFNPDSPFLIQFGPDICGSESNQVSLVLFDPHKSEKRIMNKKITAVTSTKIHTYTLILEPDGYYQILTNDNPVQNGTLTEKFPNYQGYSSICAAGLSVWHSVLDKFFRGQIIIDDILVATDVQYAEKRRGEILDSKETSTYNSML